MVSEGQPVNEPFITSLINEIRQDERPRQDLLRKIGDFTGRTAVAFFTSSRYPVMIEAGDADMIEEVLQVSDLSNGLCLVLDSPGGDALAAERIVRICREYSRGEFEVMVPRRAKSAATMIAFGANKIYMTQTATLGPIGTQVLRRETDGDVNQYSAHSIIKSYDELMEKAVNTEGHLEPYLQQLSRYNSIEIEELRAAESLAADIATRWLKEGMLSRMSKSQIRRKISIFLKPEATKAHGRDIHYDEVKKCNLNVELMQYNTPLWRCCAELYTRADYYVSSDYCKLVESPQHHFALPRPQEE